VPLQNKYAADIIHCSSYQRLSIRLKQMQHCNGTQFFSYSCEQQLQ